MGVYDQLVTNKKTSSETPTDKNNSTIPPNPNSANPNERTEIRSEERSENRPLPFPQKRRTKRYSFEFFEDQIIKLKQLKYQAEAEGRQVYLSELAREAMDQYLEKLDNS